MVFPQELPDITQRVSCAGDQDIFQVAFGTQEIRARVEHRISVNIEKKLIGIQGRQGCGGITTGRDVYGEISTDGIEDPLDGQYPSGFEALEAVGHRAS